LQPDNPETEDCFKEITVYNQGSCGSCYANAIAQMIGIRLCTEKKGRRLAELEEIPPPVGMHPYQVKAALLSAHMEPAEPRDLSTCSDSAEWSIFGQGNYNCAFFVKQDPGCKKYKDYGQRTHCKKACNTCPAAVSQVSNDNPWYKAHYEFMPSVNDLAQCANTGGQMQGCDGGNTQGVWNNWMQNLDRPLWRMGSSCKPYTMKCKSSGGVVNPLSGGACSKYAKYETWHKPCSCIGSGDRPNQFQCPAALPSAQCSVEVPHAMYTVKNVGHGLSIAEAVKNMQRHIAEFGPIYVSFATTNEFMHHDWKALPVYTGGSTVEGGHAVIAVGWGTHAGIPYWTIRNSWGADWAENGYCKFKRGVNLDGIEGRGIAASMPTSNYKDWSPPVCSLSSWSRGWGYRGTELTAYSLTLTINCNKESTVKVFGSTKLNSRKDIQSGVSGFNRDGKGHASGEVTGLKPFKLTDMGFGLATGDMWIKIVADDGKGNAATSSHFVEIGAVPGMKSIR